MNTTTPYDQLIAAKLDQVIVPDMADSIWAGIESRLDAGLGAGSGSGSPKGGMPPKGKGLWYGFLGMVTLVVLLLIWWNYSHKSKAPERMVPKENTPMIKEPLPAKDSGAIIDKPKMKPLPVRPAPASKISNGVDSVLRQYPPAIMQDTPAIRIDSLSGPAGLKIPPHIDSPFIPPPVKRSRGVKGIIDDDYKISAKKDSGAKKN